MNLRVAVTGKDKRHETRIRSESEPETRIRSESEPEEGEIVSSGDKAHFVR